MEQLRKKGTKPSDRRDASGEQRANESAGHRRNGHITREGSFPLRVALVDFGVGLWHTEPDDDWGPEAWRRVDEALLAVGR